MSTPLTPIYTTVNSTVTVLCTLSVLRPSWQGPPMDPGGTSLTYNYEGRDILSKYVRLRFASNNNSLVVTEIQREDEGQYKCSSTTATHDILTHVHVRELPSSPDIPNPKETLSNNRVVVRGTQGVSLELVCISKGSYPKQSVAWYREGTKLQSTGQDNVIKTATNTSTVTERYMFTPALSDDNKTYSCQSWFSSGPEERQTSSVLLYLKLMPSTPTTRTFNSLREGISVTIGECESTGFRPSSSFTMSMTFGGQSHQYSGSPTENILSETFSVLDRFPDFTLTRAVNGLNFSCTVGHETLGLQKLSTSVAISIQFAPLTIHVDGNQEVIANGTNPLTLTCTAGESNPAPNIVWYNGTTQITNTVSPLDSTGPNQGVIRSQKLVLYPIRGMNKDTIVCSASNSISSAVTNKTVLKLKYRPLISDIPDQTAVEGSNATLPCAANSNPPALFSWSRKGKSGVICTSIGTSGSNQGPCMLPFVNRTQTGIYTCTADNKIENMDAKDVQFTVQFPPDVTVIIHNTSRTVQSTNLHCSASGIPNTYTYSQTWTHEWPGYGKVRDWTGDENLTLHELSYAHSGVYTCSASNSIRVYGTDIHFMKGSGYLLVKDRPVITSPMLATGSTHKIATAPGKNASVHLQVFSNGGSVNTSVYTVVNSTRTAALVWTTKVSTAMVRLPVFNHLVPTQGDLIEISVLIKNGNDFGYYDVVLLNDVGERSVRINIDAEGPPKAPRDFQVFNEKQNSAEVSWLSGFHGGYPQTFVIQTRTDGALWRNASLIDGGTYSNESPFNEILSGLEPKTLYWIRLFSFNILGTSDYSIVINVTTTKAPDIVKGPSSSGALIGGAVGGSVAAIIIVVIVVVVTLRKHQKTTRQMLYETPAISSNTNEEYDSLGNSNDIRPNQPDINSSGNDNPMVTNTYDSLDGQQSSKHVYSELGHQPGTDKTSVYTNTAVHLNSGTAVYVNTTFEKA